MRRQTIRILATLCIILAVGVGLLVAFASPGKSGSFALIATVISVALLCIVFVMVSVISFPGADSDPSQGKFSWFDLVHYAPGVDFFELWAKSFKSRAADGLEERSRILTENFVATKGRSANPVAGALFGIGCFAIFAHESVVGTILIVVASNVFAFRIATVYRVHFGFFGSNSDEAIELVQFVLEADRRGHRPPPRKISRPYSNEDRSTVVVGNEIAKGVR